ncbi:MAG: hypothetical protein KZQ79_02710, partial [Candidatus Thiodiazotropha sp. (ex Lucinoma borealis)]|nr:hypothetical protein [Candidatus Thiodiazotropha sp. (ex Lucinoma borealis)]
MHPEEAQHADDKQLHEFGNDPYSRVFLEIVPMSVGMETKEALWSILMALVAGLEAIVQMDSGSWVIHTAYLVPTMAIETFGGMGIAKFVDLTVIG